MGQEALKLFAQADKVGGLVAKVRLASLARLTSTEAGNVDDTPELLRRLEDGLRTVRTERERPSKTDGQVSAEGAVAVAPAGADQARVLRRHVQTYVELMSQRSLILDDLSSTLRRIDEAAAFALDVERVSVWFLDSTQTKITCKDLFIRKAREHASGTELFAKDFAPYFAALRSERTIAAHNAHTDPRTSCFSAVYLTPLGINSMLDVPIWVRDKMVGVVCHEHIGPQRSWNADEESFAYLMSNFVALALERVK